MGSIYNLGIFGGNKTGKTLLAEAMLYGAGMIDRMGAVSEGSTTMDFDEEEIKRQMSISLSTGYIKGGKNKVMCIVDTPGYMDFIGEQIAGVEAADNAALNISADEGVSSGDEKLWEIISGKGKPACMFINKLDMPDISFDKLWDEMESAFGKKLLLVTCPLYENGKLAGVANLLDGKQTNDQSFQKYIQRSMDVIAELDDALMEKYLEGEEIPFEEILKHIKQGVIEGRVIPVLSGSAMSQTGIKEFTQFIFDYMPSSEELAPLKASASDGQDKEVARNEGQPLLGIVVKTVFDPFAGKLSYLRVFSGKLKSNSQFLNVTKNTKERVGQLLRMQGKKQESVPEAISGEVVAVAKLSSAEAFDIFCEQGNPLTFAVTRPPEGAVSYSIKPKVKGTEDKLGNAINKIAEEDPTIKVFRDDETGETIIAGMGDLHIDIAINKFKNKFGVEVEKGIPKIAYKETITSPADAEGKHKKQTGGRGQYGHCYIKVEPLPRGGGFEFVDEVVGGAIPRQFIPSVEKGIKEGMKKGSLAYYPVVDIRVRLYDGTYHTVDSSDIAFQLAGILALQKALQQGSPILLEPIVNVEIRVPQDFVGDVIGTVNAKRGKVLDMISSGRTQVVKSQVPLAEMANYTNELRSITSGQGTYTMLFSHYEVVPAHIAQKIIDERKKEKEQQ
ncbi:MAG: elongation factor G [Candidatus Omnitrophica bacterium]|nr:elongation factor G [Candidatus Omnitrophota bacterium]